MEFSKVISLRKSVRSYSNKQVEDEKLSKILDLTRLAPSWANKQCCRYIVVTDQSKINELGGLLNSWLKQAPVVIVACADPNDSGTRNGMEYYLVDVGISMQQLILTATDLGLCTCWIGGFNETKIKKVLDVPNNIKVVGLTPLGYAKEKESLTSKIAKKIVGSEKRKLLDELVHKEKW